jgi:hypothetical protein
MGATGDNCRGANQAARLRVSGLPEILSDWIALATPTADNATLGTGTINPAALISQRRGRNRHERRKKFI